MSNGCPKTMATALTGVLLSTSVGAADIHLQNHTEDAGVAVLNGPMPPGLPAAVAARWRQSGGVGVGDFDRDGFADLFVLSGGTGPDHLFISQGDGTFVDETEAWGLFAIHCGCGVAVGDVDADGWPDVYVTSFGPANGPAPGHNLLYRNQNGTGFANVADELGVALSSTVNAAFGAAFGDYDRDGRLDLCVTAWDATGEGNRLFRQQEDGTFADVTATAIEPGALDGVWGFQPAFADMDGDGWPELLISADFDSSRYFRNDGDGTFTNLTIPSGTGLDENGMGQTVGDFDNDGLLDWYVTSIFDDDGVPTGNKLYRATGPHQFQEQAAAVGADDGGWGWGTVAVDLDQDTWLDIVEVNGRNAPGGQWQAEPAKLFHNQGNGIFDEVAAAAGLDHALSGRATAWLDLENDGDLDVVVVSNDGPFALYRNQTPDAGQWLQVEPDTSAHPGLAPDGFGTRVLATTGKLVQRRIVNASPSYLGTSQPIAHFGLGDATSVDELRIEWARGQVTVLQDVSAGQRLTIAAPVPADVNADGQVDVDDLLAVILAWGPCPGLCAEDVNGDGVVDVDDLLDVILAWTA